MSNESAGQEVRMEGRTFPAGTVVHLNGVPVRLVLDANLETHPNNWKLIDKEGPGVCKCLGAFKSATFLLSNNRVRVGCKNCGGDRP